MNHRLMLTQIVLALWGLVARADDWPRFRGLAGAGIATDSESLPSEWSPPTLVQINEDRTDLVMLVAKELWGLDPKTGRLRWFADATSSGQAYTSVIAQGNRVFGFSGAGAGSVALDIGVSETNLAWTSQASATYGTPVRHQSKLYVISRGILTVLDANTGKRLEQIRLKNFKETGNSRFGSLDYASPIVVGDRLFYLNAGGQMYVFQLGEKTQLLTVNAVTTENETFWGTPAVSSGRMVVRSSKHLYCIANDSVSANTGGDQRIAVASDALTTDHKDLPRRNSTEDQFRKDAANAVREDAPSSLEGRPERPRRPMPVKD